MIESLLTRLRTAIAARDTQALLDLLVEHRKHLAHLQITDEAVWQLLEREQRKFDALFQLPGVSFAAETFLRMRQPLAPFCNTCDVAGIPQGSCPHRGTST